MMKPIVPGTRGFPNVQGGVETHCENLFPRLAGLGCDVTVITRGPYVDPGVTSCKGVRFEVRNMVDYFEIMAYTLKWFDQIGVWSSCKISRGR